MRWNRAIVFVVLSSILVLACSGGGDGECPVGTERCACTPGGACDPGLTCYSNHCVKDTTDNEGNPGGDDGGNTGGDDGGNTGGDDGGNTGGDDGGNTGGDDGGNTGGDDGGNTGGDDGVLDNDDGASGVPSPLSCTATECSFTDCNGTVHRGVRGPAVVCTASLCGSTQITVCSGNQMQTPAWWADTPCIVTWMEGGPGMNYLFAGLSCACQQGDLIVSLGAGWSLGNNDGNCDFSTQPQPSCAEADFGQCGK